MAERSFATEVQKLKLGKGETFHGEGILAVTKALLQAGVSYVGGYQGAPISHLMDVLSDAEPILNNLGVHFETSASEAAAAAMLAASVNYPLRGAVTWKSTVGTNVASDALASVASSGVMGGALIIVGEDYGEGSSIMQERSHPFAMKSQIWLIDPRPNLTSITNMVEKGFNCPRPPTPRSCWNCAFAPVMSRAASPPKTMSNRPSPWPRPWKTRCAIMAGLYCRHPISSTRSKKSKSAGPPPYLTSKKHKLNEFLGGTTGDVGIIVQGGLYNTLMRAMQLVGLADSFGRTDIPIYCLNVTYPMIEDEVRGFCADKRAVLMVEEGQPEYIEQALNTILRQADLQTRIVGKEVLPRAGEYTGQVLRDGLQAFFAAHAPDKIKGAKPDQPLDPKTQKQLTQNVPPRPVGFCTGCPERPVFTAMKLVQRELGNFHVSCDIGCHLFSILPPFNIGNTTMGYGLGWSGASAFNTPAGKRTISIMGDGGFWHNGLTSGVGGAVFNQNDNVLVIIDNGYSAATGGQDLLSSRADNTNRVTNQPIEKAVRGLGVNWVRPVNTYDLGKMVKTLREALTTDVKGPKIILAQSECMLNRQRREKPLQRKAIQDGQRTVKTRFGVDADTCTGDHACIRLSGCPSLTIADNPDPLREDPITRVNHDCVGCGVCGEIAHAAILCPSFYRAEILHNPTWWDRARAAIRRAVIGFFQRRDERKRARYSFGGAS
ncbi:MAG: indolepyruvate ferredoxin oxidoreductase subunit alpha [Robiginitomaculum sp.]|nr:indolepyruvate ferredoxin oxidoreductase subunit alpha [Robiginitomaculum sp.]